jgi:hypothetical protein
MLLRKSGGAGNRTRDLRVSSQEISDTMLQLSVTQCAVTSALLAWQLMTLLCAGKDITHKLYSLNEHLGAMSSSEAAANALGRQSDHWRTMNRSLSVDAVHTGTRGHVRSIAWRNQQQRRTSATYSNSKRTL